LACSISIRTLNQVKASAQQQNKRKFVNLQEKCQPRQKIAPENFEQTGFFQK
jgi:hypothetical protein